MRCTHIWLRCTSLPPLLPHTAAPAAACVQAAGKAVDKYGSLGRGRILRILADKMGRAGTAEVGNRQGWQLLLRRLQRQCCGGPLPACLPACGLPLWAGSTECEP